MVVTGCGILESGGEGKRPGSNRAAWFFYTQRTGIRYAGADPVSLSETLRVSGGRTGDVRQIVYRARAGNEVKTL